MFALLLAIAGACVWALWTGKVQISAGTDDLLPLGQRAATDEALVMLVAAGTNPEDDAASIDALLGLSSRLGERLGDEHVPLVPPAGEAAAWFDRFALWLVPDAALGELRARLSDEAIADAIESLRARMSSPLFGTTSEDPRRDPLALGDLTQAFAGRYGRAGAFERADPTASGDLVARDGTALLLRVRSDRDPARVLADIRETIGSAPIEAAWVGPAHRRAAAREVVATRGNAAGWIVVAAVASVLALVLRRARTALVIAASVATALLGFLVLAGTADLWTIPLLALAFGSTCDVAIARARGHDRGWASSLVLATAMVPLALLPYPGWRAWSWQWAVAIGLAGLAVLAAVRPASVVDRSEATRTRVPPLLAIASLVAALGAALWADGALRYRGADRVALGPAGESAAEAKLVADFFDPDAIVHVDSDDVDAIAALERAGEDARALATWVPEHATRVDSPGNLVVRVRDLDARRAALAELALPERLQRLRDTLASRGLRSDAFGEFLRSFDARSGAPTAAEMLGGALGPWIRGYVTTRAGGASVRSDVHLGHDTSAALPQVLGADGRVLELRGPSAAARRDRLRFRDRLAIAVLGQLWLGAFVTWIAARSLAIATATAAATLVTQCLGVAVIAALRLPIGPVVLPALLVVGTAATIAAARACVAEDLGQPRLAAGSLGAGLCQIAAPAALLVTDVPAWRDLGTIAMIGAAIALGVGLFVAPGACRLLRNVGRRRSEAA